MNNADMRGTGFRWLPLVMLIVLGAVWGGNPSFSKALIGAGVAPAAVVFWQSFLAGLVLLTVCLVRGTAIPLTGRAIAYYAFIGTFGIALAYITLVYVMGSLSVGLVSVIILMAPVLTYVFAVVIRLERVGLVRALGIGLGFVGAAVLVVPEGSLPSPEALPVALLAFIVPTGYALANVYAEWGRPANADKVALATGTMFAAALATGTISLVGGDFHAIWQDFGHRDAILVGYALATVVAFLLFYSIVDLAGAVYLGQVGYLVTLTGVGWGILFFAEEPTIWLWLAIAVVGVGVALVNFGKRKPAAETR